MGERLHAKRGARVKFSGSVSAMAGGTLEVILDGKPLPLPKSAHIDAAAWSFAFDWRADGRPHWVRLNVRDGGGQLSLVGNPIYLR